MKIFSVFNINNLKLRNARNIGLILCLILGLISSMILLFYHSVDVLLYFYIGYTLLKLAIFYFVSIIICSSAFDKIKQ